MSYSYNFDRGLNKFCHRLITEPFRQKLSTASAILHTNVIFHVEFSGMVQYFNFNCANTIKMKKTKLPGKTSWKVPIWLFLFCEWPSSEKNQFATLSIVPNYSFRLFKLFKLFLKEIGCFFPLKTFKTIHIKIFSVGFRFFS